MKDRVAPYFQEFIESMESQVALDDNQKKSVFSKLWKMGRKKFFQDKTLRERIAGQLEDNGYIFHQAGDEPMARECVTLADEVLKNTEEPTPLFVENGQYSLNVMLERVIRQVRESQGAGGESRRKMPRIGCVKNTDQEDSPIIITP